MSNHPPELPPGDMPDLSALFPQQEGLRAVLVSPEAARFACTLSTEIAKHLGQLLDARDKAAESAEAGLRSATELRLAAVAEALSDWFSEAMQKPRAAGSQQERLVALVRDFLLSAADERRAEGGGR